MFCKCFNKKSKETTPHAGTRIISENQELTNELHKPIAKKFQRCKVYSTSRDNISGADLANMQLISKYICYLLYLTNIYSNMLGWFR